MITALALVCLYEQPFNCQAFTGRNFYSTREECLMGRTEAEEQLNNTTQGVVAYRCIAWGEPT